MVVVCAVAVLLALAGALAGRSVSRAATTDDGARFRTVVVTTGDSLWTIAERARPDDDPRITVRRIMTVNRLSDPTVQPGQRLWMP